MAYLYGMLGAGIARNVYHKGVNGEHGIECHHAVGAIGHLSIEGCHTLVGLCQGAAIRHVGHLQRSQTDAVVGCKVGLHVGVFITLHLTRWKSLRTETPEGGLACRIHHRQAALGDDSGRLAIEVNVLLLGTHTPTSSLIQSKPRSSISSASSGPAVLTMRPPMSTCTMSGFR